MNPSVFFPVFLQYFADINEANSWLRERQPLLASKDYGKDESSAEALLHRHLRLEEEIAAYSSEMRRLKEQADTAAQQAPVAVSRWGIVSHCVEECKQNRFSIIYFLFILPK